MVAVAVGVAVRLWQQSLGERLREHCHSNCPCPRGASLEQLPEVSGEVGGAMRVAAIAERFGSKRA